MVEPSQDWPRNEAEELKYVVNLCNEALQEENSFQTSLILLSVAMALIACTAGCFGLLLIGIVCAVVLVLFIGLAAESYKRAGSLAQVRVELLTTLNSKPYREYNHV